MPKDLINKFDGFRIKRNSSHYIRFEIVFNIFEIQKLLMGEFQSGKIHFYNSIYPKLQSVYVGAAIQTTRQSLLETTITGSKNPTTRRPEYKQAYIIGSQHFVFSCCCCEVLKHEYCAAVYIQILCDAACFPFGTFDVSLSASLTFVGIK